MKTSVFVRSLLFCSLPWALLVSPSLSASTSHSIGSVPALHAQVRSNQIYSPTADAKADIHTALKKAAEENKRVILDFGGNWCGDCHVLDIYFHNAQNAPLLSANYVLVDINVGMYDKNLDLASKYGVPLKKGVPALVVLDSSGHVVFAMKNGEFEKMRKLDSSAVTDFLEKWKPTRA